jgi:hypothetical protein
MQEELLMSKQPYQWHRPVRFPTELNVKNRLLCYVDKLRKQNSERKLEITVRDTINTRASFMKGKPMSLPLRDIAGLLYKYWKPFKENKMKEYTIGTIFKLEPGDNQYQTDFYVLAAFEHSVFCLINLDHGSRMSTPESFEGRRVTQAELERHAHYFFEKGFRLVALEKVRLTYEVIQERPTRKTHHFKGGM